VERRLLVFEVSGRLCAFPVEAIREIVHVAATVPLPGQPSVLEGFLDYHGEPVAIASLCRLLELPEVEHGLYASFLLLDGVGVVAGAVEGVSVVSETDLQPLPAGHSFNDCAEAQFTSGDRRVVLLDSGRILLEKERRCIADLTEQARARLEGLKTAGPQP
jgi:chemotaxis signal transduction protein